MNPRFTPTEHQEQYVGSTFYESYLPRAERMTAYYPATYKLFERILGRRGALLEVGCATGHFMHVGQERGWQVVGMEVAPGLAHYARDTFGLDVRVAGQIADAGLHEESFDVVYASHVLEHLHDPRDTLEQIRGLLRGDGLLVVQVPNEFEDTLYLLTRRWIKGRFERDGLPTDHLFFYTPRTIRRLTEEAGFQVQRLSTWDWRNQRNLLRGRRAGAGLVKALLFTIGGFVGRGPNIEVIARKAQGMPSER
jgi:SAM-dependent methyltransferase